MSQWVYDFTEARNSVSSAMMLFYQTSSNTYMWSTLVEPGGGEAARGGETSSSALPTSTLSCDSGGYPLSLLEVCLGGMLACIQQMGRCVSSQGPLEGHACVHTVNDVSDMSPF